MSKYVIDAYAWLEYLEGSNLGEHVHKILNDPTNSCYTHLVTFAEVLSVAKRKGHDPEIARKAVLTLSLPYTGDITFYHEAGLLHAELRQKTPLFGLADTLVLLAAKKIGAKVVTGDPHFKGFPEVIFLS